MTEEEEHYDDEEKSVVKEITDYEEGKTTYLYDDGTYEVVYHEEPRSNCLVATACYGSALDEHVVFLRQFRDSEVMITRVGRNFMKVFNKIYYSFSPRLASFIASHGSAKLVARHIVVAPLIHLLRLSCYLMKPLGRYSREVNVLGTGITFALISLTIVWAILALISLLI